MQKMIRFVVLCLLFGGVSSFCTHGQFGTFPQTFKSYNKAKETNHNVKMYLSYSIGAGLPISSGIFSHVFENHSNGVLIGETEIQRELSGKGYHVHSSIYFPLFNISDKSVAAFNFGAVGYIFTYDLGEVRMNENNVYEYSLNSLNIGIPLSLDYKFGGEGIYDKAEKVSFTAGVGLAPMLYSTGFGSHGALSGGIHPFLHAGIGFFAGIEWKINASYLAGSQNLMKFSELEGMPPGTITFNSKPVISFSISIMPFSYDWDDLGW